MSLVEAIEIYNASKDNKEIIKFEEARSVLLEEMNNRKPKEEFYKSSTKYDYYILLPYEEMMFTKNGIEYKNHSYDAFGKNKNGKSTCHFCLSLCNYSKDEIIQLIENHIVKDNEVLHE